MSRTAVGKNHFLSFCNSSDEPHPFTSNPAAAPSAPGPGRDALPHDPRLRLALIDVRLFLDLHPRPTHHPGPLDRRLALAVPVGGAFAALLSRVAPRPRRRPAPGADAELHLAFVLALADADPSAFHAALQVDVDAVGGVEAHGELVVFARPPGFEVAPVSARLARPAFPAFGALAAARLTAFAACVGPPSHKRGSRDGDMTGRSAISFGCLVRFNFLCKLVVGFVTVE